MYIYIYSIYYSSSNSSKYIYTYIFNIFIITNNL